MEKKKISFVSVFVVVVMLAAIFMPIGRVIAAEGQQHNIWGYAIDGPDRVSAGDTLGGVITAWIDGVSYGSNTTSLVNASFDLYVDGDDWGVPEDDAVKNGGYDGDQIYYFLNYDPMNYYLDISTTTSTFDPSAYQQMVPNMFFDDQTESDIGIPGDTYLRGLKINEVVINPSSGNQYVYLYDPGGELSEAALEHATHGYYLQKDDNVSHTPDGPIFDFAAHTGNVYRVDVPLPTNYYYIELAGFTLNEKDELKLVWKNPPNWGGSPTNNNIANDTDVIVDRVEWGNYVNYINLGDPPNDRDYDNTTLSDCPGLTSTGQSYYRRPLNGTDTDDCSADFQVETATPPYVIPTFDTPGAPTDLRVHKGGGVWGGTANDLVLYWKAPTWKWDKLVKNIVYYDTDLSNGFQYTSYLTFDPNSPGPGADDWCILIGFLADANNYAFIVHTTGDTVGSYENSTGTNIGFKQGMALGPSINWIWISIPYYSDYDFASDITNDSFPDNTKITTVQKWNYPTQTYLKRSWIFGAWVGNFDIEPGDAIYIQVNPTSPLFTWWIVGAYDPTYQFELISNPTTTDFKIMSLPYHKDYQKASDITTPEFPNPNVVDIVAQYNYSTQKWESWFFGVSGWTGIDFSVYSSPADVILFEVRKTAPPYYWVPQVIVL